jgi:hypothetical protein
MAEKRVTTRSGTGKGRRSEPAGERESHNGHEIFIPRDDPGRRVVIDGEPFRYGEAADGYYLDAYAYDRDPSLVAVVKRYLDHRDAAAKREAKGGKR